MALQILAALVMLSLTESQFAHGQDDTPFENTVRPFVARYCANCHGADGDSDLNLDSLKGNFLDRDEKQKWSEVINVLNSHEMPPEDEPQPAPAEVTKVVDLLTSGIIEAERERKPDAVTMRRMNRIEYENTIRDLIGIDYKADAFPQDPSSGGFDNNGNALSLSPLHLELYYESAREILDRALVEGDQPETIKWRFEHEEASGDYNWRTYDGQKMIVHGGVCRKEGGMTVMTRDQWDLQPCAREFRLPHEGIYIVRVRAGSHIPSRDQVQQAADIFHGQQRDQDLAQSPDAYEWVQAEFEKNVAGFKSNLIYDYGSPRLRIMLDRGGQPHRLAEFDVDAPQDQPETYRWKARFTTAKSGISLEYAYRIPKLLENHWFQHRDEFPRPEIWLDWSEIEGPIYESWPPQSHKQIIPRDIPKSNTERNELAIEVIRNFATKAFRRPVTEEEVTSKLALYSAVAAETESFVEAIKAPLTAILISPDFLFIADPERIAQSESSILNQWELASRLSYFLWSTLPDDELLRLAEAGQLSSPSVLEKQVDRMLGDKRAERFTMNFAGQWLGLRQVGANPPTSELFPRYDAHVETSIVDEAYHFFHEVLMNDLSCDNFIESDWVMINERLARYYGIPDVKGDNFRKVKPPEGAHRGGLLTQAAMLTITSNGTRTSPVHRGVWILKNILGKDPGLPVANAGEIAPKVPGIENATVRQRLEVHRELPQCARCHNKIDPLGFALENFDAGGRWRDKEGSGYQGAALKDDPVIDASGVLPDGTKINGLADLQKALLARKDDFYHCLSKKMFAYGLGREIRLADQSLIEQSVSEMKANGESLRTLIKFVVTSDAFQKK